MKKQWFSIIAAILSATAALLCPMWGAGHTVSGEAVAAPLDTIPTIPFLADSPPVPPGEVAPADVEAVDNGAAGGWVIECVDCLPNVGSMDYSPSDFSLSVDSGGYPHVAYFNDHGGWTGDLEYVYQDASGWHWQIVDTGLEGYPAPGISLDLDADGYPHIGYYNAADGGLKYAYQDASGWHTEIVESGAPLYSSLALDGDGDPHISYHLWSKSALKYAYKDATGWYSETVVSGGLDWHTSTSLALDGDGYPHISYPFDGLRYVYQDVSGWHTDTADCGVWVDEYTSLALDASGYAHISYKASSDLKYAYQNASGWHSQTLDSEGIVGEYNSLGMDDSGYVHIGYYDGTNDDLKYAYQDASEWHTQTLDSEGDVGQYTSLARDNNGYTHIAYYDETNDDLKYAYQDISGWHTQTVELEPEGYVGLYTSLALDGSGYAHVSYYDWSSGDLKYAYQDASNWYSQTVDSSGDVGSYTSLALAGDGYPHISYYDATNDEMKYAYLDGFGWHSQTVDSGGDVGRYTSLALEPTAPYTPHISYYDATNQHPKYAYLGASGWFSETVGRAFPGGTYTSIVLRNGYAHISYYEHYNGDLIYIKQLSGGAWLESVVAYYSESWWTVGQFNSLALDTLGNPYISYYDGFLGALRVATGWAPVGWSTMWTVDSIAVWDTSLVMDGGYGHISYYDALHGTLKYAYQDASGWYSQTVDSDGNVGQYTSLALDGDGHPHISYHDADKSDLKYAYYTTRPVATFTASPTTSVRPLTVVFTDTSTGEITAWDWAFGDGGISSQQNPTHTYTSAGVYTVSLTTSGPDGSDTLTRTNYITVTEPPPVAGFTAHPTSADRPLTVVFTDTSTGTITIWDWAFGDGDVSSQQNPTHTYTSAGVYTVSLTVSGPGGSDTLSRTNYITVTEPPPAPQVDFSGAPRSGDTPLPVQFTSTVTGTVTAYDWLFGDGGVADTPNPTHTYASAGNFGVTLVVTGPGGIADVSKPGYITVNAPPGAPTATFGADVVSGTAPLTVTFTAITSGTVEHWLWNFGDGGTTFTGPVVSHAYVTSGTFDVSLTVSNTHGSFVVSEPGYITVREKGEEPSYSVYLPLVMRSYKPH